MTGRMRRALHAASTLDDVGVHVCAAMKASGAIVILFYDGRGAESTYVLSEADRAGAPAVAARVAADVRRACAAGPLDIQSRSMPVARRRRKPRP